MVHWEILDSKEIFYFSLLFWVSLDRLFSWDLERVVSWSNDDLNSAHIHYIYWVKSFLCSFLMQVDFYFIKMHSFFIHGVRGLIWRWDAWGFNWGFSCLLTSLAHDVLKFSSLLCFYIRETPGDQARKTVTTALSQPVFVCENICGLQ